MRARGWGCKGALAVLVLEALGQPGNKSADSKRGDYSDLPNYPCGISRHRGPY